MFTWHLFKSMIWHCRVEAGSALNFSFPNSMPWCKKSLVCKNALTTLFRWSIRDVEETVVVRLLWRLVNEETVSLMWLGREWLLNAVETDSSPCPANGFLFLGRLGIKCANVCQVFRVWFNGTNKYKYQIYHLYEMYNFATYTYHPNLLARIKCGQTKHVGASPLPKRRYRSQKKPQKNNKVCFIYRKKGENQNWTPPNRSLYILLPWVGLFFGTSPHKKQPNQLPSCTAILRLAIHLIHRTSSTWPSWITQHLPIWKTSLSRGTVDVMWST